MVDEIQDLMVKYWAWLRDKTALRQVGDVVEITAPYLDRHNDYLQIYVKREDGGFLITDGGHTIADLEMSGCAMDGAKRQGLLRTTLAGFGVQYEDSALQVRATPKTFSLCKHNLMQAMLAVNDLFYTARAVVAGLFNEDVGKWLTQSDIRYVSKTKLSGQSGYDHFFDFVIPSSSAQPEERLIRAINRPDRNAVQAAVFSWQDTKQGRVNVPTSMYVFLNDAADPGKAAKNDPHPKRKIAPAALSALKNDGICPVPWSDRDKVREQLAA